MVQEPIRGHCQIDREIGCWPGLWDGRLCMGQGHHWLYYTESTDQDTMKQFAITVQLIPLEWAAASETDRLAGYLHVTGHCDVRS